MKAIWILVCLMVVSIVSVEAASSQTTGSTRLTAVELKKLLDTRSKDLKSAADKSGDPCLKAQFIAISDSSVVKKFEEKIAAGHVFKGVKCLGIASIPEHKYVNVDFDCKPQDFCLIDPNFLVVVNTVESRVVDIIDPFMGQATGFSLSSSKFRTLSCDPWKKARCAAKIAGCAVVCEGEAIGCMPLCLIGVGAEECSDCL